MKEEIQVMQESQTRCQKILSEIGAELDSILRYSKVLKTIEYNEMADNMYIKVIAARKDLLCATVLYGKEITQLVNLINARNLEFQIYTDECDKLKYPDCLSINIYP